MIIFGIVAGVSIPSIINNYKKRISVTKLQKAYATLEKAAVNIKISTGCNNLACTGLLEYDNNKLPDLTDNFFELGGIIANKRYTSPGGLLRVKAMNYNNISAKQNALGTLYAMLVDKNNIGYYVRREEITTNINPKKTETGLVINIYTNPDIESKHKEYLQIGTDIYSDVFISNKINEYTSFVFVIYGDFIVEPKTGCSGGAKYPLSVYNDADAGCNKNSSTNCYGNSCAAKIIKDGWKINY